MANFTGATGIRGRSRDLAVLVASSMVIACHPATEQTYSNVGKTCVLPEGSPVNVFQRTTEAVSLQADRPARVTVVIPVCLNAQCSHDPEAECTATVTGDRIDITSHASFLQESGVCPQDCRGLSADCATPPLPAGTYLVRHGADSMTVSIPSVRPVPCMGTTPFDGSLAGPGAPPAP
jgi:hypothetical protein